MKRHIALLGFACILCLGRSSAADDIDRIEQLLGATRINAALGHGGLTAAFSWWGELTVLRWPNPSYYEHLNYTTAGGKDARKKPYFGAQANEGSFPGVMVVRASKTTVSWLRDAGWTQDQRYATDTTDTLLNTYTNKTLGIKVEETAAVDPRRDVLVRRFVVTPTSAVDALALIYYENFAPTLEKADYVPNDSNTHDFKRDYALVYDHQQDALLHLSVKDRPQSLLSPLQVTAPGAAAVDTFIASLGGHQGTYLLLGGSTVAKAWQCGLDSVDGKGLKGPEDAFLDAADGALSGSRAAVSHATGALRFDLDKGGGEVSVFVAAGASVKAARQVLDAARKDGAATVRAASDKAWKDWLAKVRLPDTSDVDRLRIARRALISIRTATDAKTSAVVASVSCQPPYNLDWPRDGAFINYALDVAGKHDTVARHNKLYAAWQRKEDGQDALGGAKSPAGSFAMNYYADGRPGGPIPFEIDQVGLVLWSYYQHARFLSNEASQQAYLESIWAALQQAADLLKSCVDPQTGLQCSANEDDDYNESISLHGAAAVLAGLKGAVRAARFLKKHDKAQGWLTRVRELEAAIDAHIYQQGQGHVRAVPGQSKKPGTGQLSWTIWPAQLLPAADQKMQQTAAALKDKLQPFFAQQNAGGAYHAKGTLALALHYSDPAINDQQGLVKVREWIDLLVKQLPTPGTGHYGEAYLYTDLDNDGKKEYDNRVSIPHVWEATLVYLSLMAAYSPQSMRPAHLAPLEAPADEGGCSCTTSAGRSGSVSIFPLMLLLGLLFGTGRRREQ